MLTRLCTCPSLGYHLASPKPRAPPDLPLSSEDFIAWWSGYKHKFISWNLLHFSVFMKGADMYRHCAAQLPSLPSLVLASALSLPHVAAQRLSTRAPLSPRPQLQRSLLTFSSHSSILSPSSSVFQSTSLGRAVLLCAEI